MQTVPNIDPEPTQLFVDIEGIPQEQRYYLIGITVTTNGLATHESFWANTAEDESTMWRRFSEFTNRYHSAPIFHYGSYDKKAVKQLTKRYGSENNSIDSQLINVLDHIYAKVYFPTYSNSLKDIGRFLGSTWSTPGVSGIDTIAWRYKWELNADSECKRNLLIYNEEDCRALRRAVEFLESVHTDEDSIVDVDHLFNNKKSYGTPVKNTLHSKLEEILKLAHSPRYDSSKIAFRGTKKKSARQSANDVGAKRRRTSWRITRSVEIAHPKACPKCDESLSTSSKTTERVQADLVFTKNDVRKSITQRWCHDGRCPECRRYFKAPSFSLAGRPVKYGLGFKLWVAYLRIGRRMSYGCIQDLIRDTFSEDLDDKLIINYIADVAGMCREIEQKHLNELLMAKVLNVDETQLRVNDGYEYVWVLTNGRMVHFCHTETRESSFIVDLLSGFDGTLVTDFFPGYDRINCRHQKCLVHLIRDMNNDLWASPFDDAFSGFVAAFRDLLLPMMDAIDKYGLKARHLRKFQRSVDRFHVSHMEKPNVNSELISQYRKRMVKYWTNLFTFLNMSLIE